MSERKPIRRYLTRLVTPAVWHLIGKSASRRCYDERYSILLSAVLAWERSGKAASSIASVRRSIACRLAEGEAKAATT